MPGISDLYRDSIGSSDYHYTNPYRNDFDYRRAEHARSIRNRTLDKLETTQQGIERELLEKILAKKGKLSAQNTLLLQQLGKFLFMVLMLPPYIVFYGIPKSAYKKLVPIIKSIIHHAQVTLTKSTALTSFYLAKIFTWPQNKIRFLSSKLDQKISELKLKIHQKLLAPVALFANYQKNKIQSLLNRVVRPLRRLRNNANQLVKYVLNTFTSNKIRIPKLQFSLPKISLKLWSEKFKRLKEKFEETASFVKKKAQELFNASIKFVESSWLFLWQPLAQIRLPQYKLPGFSGIKQIYANALKSFTQTIKPIFALIKAGQDAFHYSNQKIANFFKRAKDSFAKQWVKLAAMLFKKWQKVNLLFKRKKNSDNKAKEKLKQYYKKTKGKCEEWTEAFVSGAKNTVSFFTTWLSKVFSMLTTFLKNFFISIRIFYALICILLKFIVQGIKERLLEEIRNS